MARRFEDQVVWITGGGTGIGRALAIEYAKAGAVVAVSGRRREKLDEVVRAIRAERARGLADECDVTDETSVKEAAEEVVRTLGRLDIRWQRAKCWITSPDPAYAKKKRVGTD